MGPFHVFKIGQMVSNGEKHHGYKTANTILCSLK